MENRVDEFIKNPKKALLTLALPMIIAMIVQVMYNVVDTAFVGRLGADAIAALTFSFPIFFILIALNSGLGVGMSSRISRFLGEKRKEDAENTAMHGLFISIIFGLFIFVGGIIFLRPIFSIFGAANSVLELSIDYMSIILFGIFFMFSSFMLNNIFSSQGDTKTPMKVQIFALILNIILDPIFIYVLGYGVRGAAIATVIAFALSLILFIYYIKKKSYLKIHLSSFKFSFSLVKEIFLIGLPASLMMLLISVYFMFINKFMAYFGTNYVASFGIASRLESVITMPIVALSIAMLTLVGMFFGAKRYELLKEISWYGIKISILFASAIGVVFFLLPSLFLRIFTPDATLLAISSAYLRIEIFIFPLFAVSMIISRVMQGMGFGMPGLVINLVRTLLISVPLAYIFVFILKYGYLSIAAATIIGGVISSIVAIIWMEIEFKKIESR